MTDLVNLRGWPGLDKYQPPRRPRTHPRITERMSLIMFAAGDAAATVDAVAAATGRFREWWAGAEVLDADGVTLDDVGLLKELEAARAAEVGAKATADHADRLGVGGFLIINGPEIIDGGLIVADDLAGRDPAAFADLDRWAKTHPLATIRGRRRWAIVTVSEFFNPVEGVTRQPPRGVGVFLQRAWRHPGFVIGADLGRTFGLFAEHVVCRREPRAHEFEIWLPGWGYYPTPKGVKRTSDHNPQLRLSSRRVGWSVEFAPCKRGFGQRVDGLIWRGAFVDLPSLAYALDGDRSASFAEHRTKFGLVPADLPVAVAVDAHGAAAIAEALRVLHETALALDEHASRWFGGRVGVKGHLDLARTTSPGAVAGELVARTGVTAPLEKFNLDLREHQAWAETFHGGWSGGPPECLGTAIPVVAADLSSAYPLVAHHLDWWPFLTAERLEREDVTGLLRSAVEHAATDPAAALDPALWRRLGFTIAEVDCAGEPWPVEIEDSARPDGHFLVVPVTSRERPLWMAWADVVSAAARSGRVPTIRSATRLVPVGRQPGMRPSLPILPGLTIDPRADDPAVALVRHRRKLKATGRPGDRVLAAELRVVVNSLVFGNPSRFDPTRRKVGRRWETFERPGPWSFMPLASSVAAGARLLLGVADRMVTDAGGTVIYRDTDSSFIAASPAAGDMELPDGSKLRLLSWSEADGILARFERLRVSADWPVWTTKRGGEDAPLRSVQLGPKRHVEFVADGAGITVIGRTDANLGGSYIDPPACRGRAADELRAWTLQVAGRAVERADARATGDDRVFGAFGWDDEADPFPAFHRRQVSSPKVLKSLPGALEVRPASRFVEASVPDLGGPPGSFVALDPGGDLAGWRQLAWFRRSSGERVWPAQPSALGSPSQFKALDDIAGDWCRPLRIAPVASVSVAPLLVRHVGRVSGMIDAATVGAPGDLADERPTYDAEEMWADRREAVAAYAKTLGPHRFSRQANVPLRTAKRAALGQQVSKATVMRALRSLRIADLETRRCEWSGCRGPDGEPRPLFRANARYCCNAHSDRAYRERRREQPNGK